MITNPPMKMVKAARACSLCEKMSEDGLIVKGELAICQRCIYYANTINKIHPVGAMYCHKCKSYETVLKVRYLNGSSATFAYYDLDSKGCPIYLAVEASGDWNLLRVPKSITCKECERTIPLWFMRHNSTMRPKSE
jgi:hypothetical protein